MNLSHTFKDKSTKAVSGYKELEQNRIIRLGVRWSLLFITLSILVLVVVFRRLPPVIPLWYSKPWGTERLAHPGFLFLLPFSSLVWLLITFLFSLKFTREHLVFSQILFMSVCAVSLLSLIAVSMIVWIII